MRQDIRTMKKWKYDTTIARDFSSSKLTARKWFTDRTQHPN